MTLELLDNPWLWFFLIGITISIMSILVGHHQSDLINLKKSIGDIELALIHEDHKINENFEKIHKDLSMVEREVNQALITVQTKHKKQSSRFKPVGKKLQKFLTPKGKIKKHYRDNPIAQKCYQKFHSLQNI